MERRAVVVQGTVQGVGFRPYVFGLATRLDLKGFVRNDIGGVHIEIEGEVPRLNEFLNQLAVQLPPLAHIESLRWRVAPTRGDRRFCIKTSRSSTPGSIAVSPDVATCASCLAELFDPANRRYRYPFINCTDCGPRLTIVTGAPYDRPQTTMAGFAMCHECRREYEDPGDRRFHAQPIACPACGPRLRVLDASGATIATTDPLIDFVRAVREGQIGALKGLGGYHLVCDARHQGAVSWLRRRKHRDEKPLAIMVRDLAAARQLCEISAAEGQLLTSPARPIVLLARRRPSLVAPSVAPGSPHLGLMLPYTPLHHLLTELLDDMPLVMTSGNRADEPIAYEDNDAVARLAGIADLFLTHDRPIYVRCDDSVTRVVAGREMPLRRSRGLAPRPITLPAGCPLAMLAVGGQLKSTFALGRDRQAVVSQHLGDLDDYAAFRAFERDIQLYQRLFRIEPRVLVHDLHPDYVSTRYAIDRGARGKVPCIAVQHHHAHLASCLAEHQLLGSAIGVTFDGAGLGTDGAIWGGEFLIGDYAQFVRAAHLRYVRMPGAEQAIREPWRMAVAHLLDAGFPLDDCLDLVGRDLTACNGFAKTDPHPVGDCQLTSRAVHTIASMIARGLNSPLTSSAGRLFDAVAALIGLVRRVSFEGQAAMSLEYLAGDWTGAASPYPFDIIRPSGKEAPRIIDTRPLVRAIVDDLLALPGSAIAARFHATMASLVTAVCRDLRKACGQNRVLLTGGVFVNARLTSETMDRLRNAGFEAYRHERIPTNDGGLSFGQLAVAAAQCQNLPQETLGVEHVPGNPR